MRIQAINLDDTRAVLARLVVEINSLAGTGRRHPNWLIGALDELQAHLERETDDDLSSYEVLAMAFVLGVLAEREGWPLVGDR